MLSTFVSWCRLTITFLPLALQLSFGSGNVFARITSSCAICSRQPWMAGKSAFLVPSPTESASIACLVCRRVSRNAGSSALMWRNDLGTSVVSEWNLSRRCKIFELKWTSWTMLATTPTASAI
ncbi:hypothetical protein K469DRAFT_332812 [Zopfia rhizophila CBS 207.26]|uniref:Secreted protein n=1 Tax=Zopfia rhizophila CBS 207.26 TaxID=1314779 RepID=A0A6A6DJI6_9PEZI|nr:hypothetical protein K469DRAFT_332812 [Zopfia rhizophila CBS 207.26]